MLESMLVYAGALADAGNELEHQLQAVRDSAAGHSHRGDPSRMSSGGALGLKAACANSVGRGEGSIPL